MCNKMQQNPNVCCLVVMFRSKGKIGRKFALAYGHISFAFPLLALSKLRRLFAQPYAPFDMGDLRVLATAWRTQVRLRAAVLHKSPHLKRLCSAMGQINAALGIFECVHRRSKPLFVRSRDFCRLLPRRPSTNPHRHTSSLALFARRSCRRHPRLTRVSSRPSRTVVVQNRLARSSRLVSAGSLVPHEA